MIIGDSFWLQMSRLSCVAVGKLFFSAFPQIPVLLLRSGLYRSFLAAFLPREYAIYVREKKTPSRDSRSFQPLLRTAVSLIGDYLLRWVPIFFMSAIPRQKYSRWLLNRLVESGKARLKIFPSLHVSSMKRVISRYRERIRETII